MKFNLKKFQPYIELIANIFIFTASFCYYQYEVFYSFLFFLISSFIYINISLVEFVLLIYVNFLKNKKISENIFVSLDKEEKKEKKNILYDLFIVTLHLIASILFVFATVYYFTEENNLSLGFGFILCSFSIIILANVLSLKEIKFFDFNSKFNSKTNLLRYFLYLNTISSIIFCVGSFNREDDEIEGIFYLLSGSMGLFESYIRILESGKKDETEFDV